jgi:uncharacterized integral membrane protein (TIGR00698 family)
MTAPTTDIAIDDPSWPGGNPSEVAPGLMLCAAVTVAAFALAEIEQRLFGHPWLEPLVLAILVGAAIRALWSPGARWTCGINFGAKTLLEVAVVLLGASVSMVTLTSLGGAFVLGIFLLVAVVIGVGFGLGRALGLNPRIAMLVACGNAICGNSAIAAVAPVIDADGEDIATSIAFTAVLGVIVVLTLPLLGVLMQMSALQFGALTGLTVYAVPQVLAAAAPFGAAAAQTGTVVKLVRVLMLGPVVFTLSLIAGRRGQAGTPGLHRLVPWFIIGFIAMIGLRSTNLIPQAALPGLATASGLLTVTAMAALGLQTDIRAVARAGGRVVAAVVFSLAALLMLALLLIRLMGL